MARKGSRKSRSGCLTCKIRKVKCDETKPCCQRCTSTGRTCDGYRTPSDGLPTWDELLSTVTVKPTLMASCRTGAESRAADYFQSMVAPIISGHFSHEFWTRLVLQVSNAEPAVHHAMISISALYEHLESGRRPLLESETGRYALTHYNQAVRQLATKSMDSSLVLLTCILFICVESLCDNHEGAIEHCRHGINILNGLKGSNKLIRDDILPFFVRLSIFPFFFGRTVYDFPCVKNFGSFSLTSFSTLEEARYALDVLSTRTIRFMRWTCKYREGEPVPKSVLSDQQIRLESIQLWRRTWATFKAANPPSQEEMMGYAVLEMKSCIGLIWTGVAVDRTEMSYDQYTPIFQQMLDCAEAVQPSQSGFPDRRQYIFEMGFAPLLYFAASRCRVLSIRVAALEAMWALSASRETLWDTALMYATGRCIIEFEHGIDYFEALRELTSSEMPPDEMRIRDSVADEIFEARSDGTVCRRTTFFTWSSTGAYGKKEKVISINPNVEVEAFCRLKTQGRKDVIRKLEM